MKLYALPCTRDGLNCGISAAIASIEALVFRVKLQQNLQDATWNVSYVPLWASVISCKQSVKSLTCIKTGRMYSGLTTSSITSVNQLYSQGKMPSWSWISSLRFNLSYLFRTNIKDRKGRMVEGGLE